MQRNYLLLVFAIFLNLSMAKADRLRDSIGVENLNGKKLILHKTVAKDTYYSIARRYGVSPKEVMAYNDNKYLQIGVLIKVPTQIPFAQSSQAPIPVSVSTSAPFSGSVLTGTVAENTEIIEHAVQRKENLSLLAEKYGTTIDEIKRINDLKTINLKIGQILKIPAKPDAAEETAGTTPPPSQPVMVSMPSQNQYKKQEPVKKEDTSADKSLQQDEFIVHTVASNETIYSIATKYDLTLDQLKAKNNLSTNSLYVGQKLLVKGQYPVKGSEAAIEAEEMDTMSIKDPSLRLPPSRYGLSQMEERGTGTWIIDPDLDSSKMLVLHRTAAIGTIMKITNPMSNRSAFAKVVGKFTENQSTKDVIIVMTKAVADALGALDKKFLCNLTYSGQTNEQQ